MKICPTCDGEGQFQIEYDVIDYVSGGYIATKWVPCEYCFGSGEDFDVLDDEDE